MLVVSKYRNKQLLFVETIYFCITYKSIFKQIMTDYKDYSYSSADYSHISNYILDPLLTILKEKKREKILDIGCGNGWLTNLLIDKGYDAYGTDASKSGIDIAKSKHNDRFFIQDLTKDDLPPQLQNIPFSTILSTEVIEHLYQPRDYVQFCKKVLLKASGGELILTTPYHGYLKNVILSGAGQMDKHFTALWDGGHIKFWSKNTITQLLEEAGFTVTGFLGCGRLPYLWKSMIIRAKII